MRVKGGRFEGVTELCTGGRAVELTVEIKGTADLRSVKAMDEFVRGAHAEALAGKVSAAVVDLRQLEFMSSSNIVRLVCWIGWIEESTQRYRMRIRTSRRYHWQKRSMHALRCFSPELVEIVAE